MSNLTELIESSPDFDLETFLGDGDIVTDLVILARVQRLEDTADALCVSATEHTGQIIQIGMLHKALLMVIADDRDDEAEDEQS